MQKKQKRIYLDYNATAPLLESVKNKMIESFSFYGNPSSIHEAGREARYLIETSRDHVASLCNVSLDHVIFTSGATEAAATLLKPDWFLGEAPLRFSTIYMSQTEHPCVLQGHGFDTKDTLTIPVKKSGILNLEDLEYELQRRSKQNAIPLITVQAANQITGVLQPLKEIKKLTSLYKGLLIVDAVQYIGRCLPILSEKEADFLFLSAHKIGGPKGIGAWISFNKLFSPKPLLRGGGQERGLRSGTQALSLIAGFGAAAKKTKQAISLWTNGLQSYLEGELLKQQPQILIFGYGEPRLPNTTFFSIPGKSSETMQMIFDLHHIHLSAGSACSSGKIGTNDVMQAMGENSKNGGIRISTGLETSLDEINYFLYIFQNFINKTS